MINATPERPNLVLAGHIEATFRNLVSLSRQAGSTGVPTLIHQTRTTIRRLQSQLLLVSTTTGDDQADFLLNETRGWMKLPGRIRDLQVQSMFFTSRMSEFPELEALIAFLEEQVQVELKGWQATNPHMAIEKAEPVIRHISTILHAFENRFVPSQLLRMQSAIFRSVSADLKSIHGSSVNELHRFRIRVKKYRYQLESLSLLTRIPSKEFGRLINWQKQLGEIQDLEVAESIIRESGIQAGLSPGQVQAMIQAVQKDQKRLIRKVFRNLLHK